MKITIHDNWLGKFSGVLMEHWREKGHEVAYEPGYSPYRINDSDVVFFESADLNIGLANREKPKKKGKIFCRVVDVDAYSGGPGSMDPKYTDGIIFIAKHIQEYCNERYPNVREIPQHFVRMGIDLEKFTYREKGNDHRIAFISTRLTHEKGFDYALQLLAELRKKAGYTLHVVGTKYDNQPWEKYIEHLIKSNDLEEAVVYYGEWEGFIGDFLEDKDYLLLPSKKEAFSFVAAEAMAKGLKPVIGNFWGAQDIWSGDTIFKTPVEALDMLREEKWDGKRYRHYIETNFPLEKHLEEMDKAMGI